MRRMLIVLFAVAHAGVALAQSGGTGSGSGGAGGAPAGSGAGAASGAVPPAPTGHRQPRPADLSDSSGVDDRAQKLQEKKNVEGDKTMKSICSNCGAK